MKQSICKNCLVSSCCEPSPDRDCKKIMLLPENLFNSIRVKNTCPDCGGKQFNNVRSKNKKDLDNIIECEKCKSKFQMWGRWNYTRIGKEYEEYYQIYHSNSI